MLSRLLGDGVGGRGEERRRSAGLGSIWLLLMQRCVGRVTCVLFLAFGPAKRLPGFLLVISLRFRGSGCFGFRYFCSLLANEVKRYIKKLHEVKA